MKRWKKRIHKIPEETLQQLKMTGGSVRVGVVKAVSPEEFDLGLYEHLGVKLDHTGQVQDGSEITPDPERGPWSRKNVEGWEEKHKDLPMVSYTIPIEVPNWGDWSKGSHTIEWEKKKYQVTYHHPQFLTIKSRVLGRNEDGYPLVRFLIERPVEVGKDGWLDTLFFYANLMVENTGAYDFYSTEATLRDYLAKERVAWQLFPADEGGKVVRLICNSTQIHERRDIKRIEERVETLQSLRPQKLVIGTDGFQSYFGAVVRNDLVVFENVRYGNAIYVMNEQWKTLTKRSRSELMASKPGQFTRITHTRGWKRRLKNEVQRRLA